MLIADPQKQLEIVFFQEADVLLFEGTNPWELDEAAVSSGFRQGPCEMQDLLGLDIVQRDRMQFWPHHLPIPILGRMLQEGRLGKKVGVGWYRYPGGGRVVDPLIEDLIREECYFAKVDRRDIPDAEIGERLRQVLNDKAQLLIAASEASTNVMNEVLDRTFGVSFKAD